MVFWRMRWQQDGQLCLKAATVGSFVLFCIKLLRNIHLGAATVINLTAGGRSMCRKGFTFCIVRQMSRFSQVWYSQLSVVCKTLNWAAFLITFYGCDWKGFDKRGSFMFDLFALLLSFLTGTKNKILSKHEPKKHIVHFLYTLLLVYNCCKSDSCFHDWWINHNLIGRPANTQQLIQGGFFNWSPPKKYVKPRLGESTLT